MPGVRFDASTIDMHCYELRPRHTTGGAHIYTPRPPQTLTHPAPAPRHNALTCGNAKLSTREAAVKRFRAPSLSSGRAARDHK